jgi:predicted transcriptional regulator
MEQVLFVSKIKRGIQQADEGSTMSHEDVKQRLSEWLN